ncbi:AhpC/TSA family protein [Sphingomonas ginsenosidivorax]|uniref:AhpC/TSA family protein n=1 Tax=Sphingomonas ginsenosidivorax TaxID=862135 RepID=A0A5C6UEU9_9SPHN|nr:peroxiredoxin-like family protein [Sphingomonas ginsenosidivorax]TXC71303.1 AhpC/TSA family protein [Sphingomonas ginsenosidivorax]
MSHIESLTDQFVKLHADRVATWPSERLAKNIEQRAALVAAFDPATVVQVGDVVAPFTLDGSDGTPLTLETLVADRPGVLVFFRFAGCPACNLALPYYDRQLRPALDAAGIRLVAVSPHLPERSLGAIRDRHDLHFAVAADRDNTLARRLGITFARGDVPAETAPGWIGELTGIGTSELPQPTVIVIDQDRIVRFVDVSPDWLVRTEAPVILAAVARLELAAAA